MYRRYENPYELQDKLDNLIKRQDQLTSELDNIDGCKDNAAYVREAEQIRSELMDLEQDINEMQERVNFAWQDDEAE